MRVHEAVLFTVGCICRFRPLIQFGVGITKHEPDVYLRALFLDEQMLLPVCCIPDTFCFDIKKAALLGQPKVRCVLGFSLWYYVVDFVLLIYDR